VDYDNDSLHFDLPSQTKRAVIRQQIRLAGFEFGRCYTIAPGIVTPGEIAISPAPLRR
jgi:hypothetical protein